MLKTIARGLAGLLLAGAIVFALFAHQGAGWRWLISGGWHSSARIAALTPEEQTWAAIARRYFVNNTQPQTGLVNGNDKQPASRSGKWAIRLSPCWRPKSWG